MNGAVMNAQAQAKAPWPIRKAEFADIPELARMFADAFRGDPYIEWIVRADARRDAARELLFQITLNALSSGLRETYAVESLAGCVIWKQSGDCKLSVLRQLALIPAFCRVGGLLRINALARAFAHLDELHERYAPQAHQYLHVVGVSPEHQGSGIGRSLLEPALRRFDQQGEPAYLETFKPRNVPFYERLGFRTVGHVKFAPLPPGWLMLREPTNQTRGAT
jgi:ribosomal protein S18 acetylase RimI-like enzyme